MTAKSFAFAEDALDSAEYVLYLAEGVVALMSKTKESPSEYGEKTAWAASAVGYLLAEAKECVATARRNMKELAAEDMGVGRHAAP